MCTTVKEDHCSGPVILAYILFCSPYSSWKYAWLGAQQMLLLTMKRLNQKVMARDEEINSFSWSYSIDSRACQVWTSWCLKLTADEEP